MLPEAETKPTLFDDYVENYDAACDCGLRFAGENRDHFAQRRVEYTGLRAEGPSGVRWVMDFGCGPGHATPHLVRSFPRAKVLGIDNANAMVEAARQKYGGDRARFICADLDPRQHRADLVYCNGVFHHIPPADRARVARDLFDCLSPGGQIALWENNPWNPGTRLVMSRIPFDRDAIPLPYRETQVLLRSAGFRIRETTFHFYFPSLLKALRRLEPLLRRVPLGGQYCVLAEKPASP